VFWILKGFFPAISRKIHLSTLQIGVGFCRRLSILTEPSPNGDGAGEWIALLLEKSVPILIMAIRLVPSRRCIPLILLGMALAPVGSLAKPQYGYQGDVAPENWGKLSPEYAKCTDGAEQAPVNIVSDRTKRKANAPVLVPSYQPTSGDTVVNTGTTIQVNTEGRLLIGNAEYKLLQYHFHTPSEEAINGVHYAMNVHLVHQDAAGKLAVIGVNFVEGSPNSFISSLWKLLPSAKGQKVSASLPSLEGVLPKDLSYYTYAGSLTTPPCSEGVQFYILKTPETISPAQLAAFQKLYPMNARPLQPLNERVISTSD
jgi:carbonic anhydrase